MRKRLLSFLLAALLLLTLLPQITSPVSAATSGSFNGLSWSFNTSSGKLTITGTGSMPNWSLDSDIYPPWNDYMDSIKSVSIGSGVTSVGDLAFWFADGLTSVSLPNTVKRIGSRAFSDCYNLSSLTLPTGLTEIGDEAFYSSGLTQLSPSSGLKTIGDFAFAHCNSLSTVKLPNTVTEIGYGAFTECYNLSSLTLSSQLTAIPGDAFRECASLTSVTIPASVTEIYFDAFQNCTSLTSVSLPASLVNIWCNPFKGCTALTAISVNSSSPYYTAVGGVVFSKDKSTLVVFPGGKSGAYTVPSTVDYIGDDAFFGAESLTSVTIPASVTWITPGAFRGCENLASFSVNSASADYTAVSGVLFSKDKTHLVAFPGGKSGAYTVPSTVTDLEMSCFADCHFLTSVTVPASVTSIEEYAFEDCWELTSANISASVSLINYSLFGNCYQLKSVTLPASVTEICDCAFSCCYALSSVALPAKLTRIDECAFYSCGALTKLTVPDKVTFIGTSAFEGCTTLSSLTLGSGLKTIDCFAFFDCYALKSVNIPAGVTEINDCAFGYYEDDYGSFEKIPGFQISGTAGTAAQSYANGNGFPFTAASSAPVVTTQPANVSAALGKNATMKVAASGSGLKYQWQYSKNNGAAWTDWSGKTTASITFAASSTNNGCLYRCVVKNSAGTATSSAARLTVTGVKPNILVQPAAASTTLGKNVTFKVTAWGSGLSYQWQFSKTNGADWYDWSGKTTASITFAGSATNNGCLYRCVVKNSSGSVTSSAVRLTVTDAKPVILTQPANASAALGASVTMKVAAGGSGLSYQWQFSKNNGSSWSNWSGKTTASISFAASSTNNGCLYRCVVKNSYGSVTSNSAKLTVTGSSGKPAITSQPSSVYTTLGSSVTMSVTASGSGLSYQWQFSKDSGGHWYDWSGKTTASISFPASLTNNGCLYRCVVKNSAGSVNSASARLTVTNARPNILVQPENATVAKGSDTSFSVYAWSNGAMSYQWQFSKDGGTTWYNWSGKTSSLLQVTGSATNNGCLYRCVVTNSYGSVTSGTAKLTVT